MAGCGDRRIRIYDIRSGREVAILTGHKVSSSNNKGSYYLSSLQGSVQCLQFDDYKIVSGSWDTTCIVSHYKIYLVIYPSIINLGLGCGPPYNN